MKFLCSHCKAKYQIADEKVAGRTLRMTCRQCKEEIVIRGEAPARANVAIAPAPPSALSAEFQRKVGAGVRASVPPPPLMIDEWHVAIDDVPVGPIRREEIARRIGSGSVHPESLAWREGLDDWLPLRQIPELAILLSPTSVPAPALPVQVIPTQRAEVAPVGGRAGAAPAFSLDDWAPPPVDPSLSQQMHRSSLDAMPRQGGMPSWGVMFAVACGFAFLMSALTILGARWLSKGEPHAAAPVPTAPVAPTPAPATPEPAQEDEPSEMVIELDEIAMDDETSTGTRRPGTKTNGTTKPKSNGKQLTDAQREMLARMGGGTEADLGALRNNDRASGESHTGGGGGGLTAAQITQTVMRGRKNLQRCYETALRGSGSTDTVKLNVEVSISPAGNVTSVRTSGAGALPGMKECIERTVKMWRFPNAGEASATKFPVVFQPGA